MTPWLSLLSTTIRRHISANSRPLRTKIGMHAYRYLLYKCYKGPILKGHILAMSRPICTKLGALIDISHTTFTEVHKFYKLKMAAAAILKNTQKGVSQIWYADRYWQYKCQRGPKYYILESQDGGRCHLGKYRQGCVSECSWPICTNFITRMRGSAIRSVRSQCQSQWERRNFAPPHSPNPSTNFDGDSNISLCPPREWMCKIWRKSILPLWICACVKKRVFVWIFFANMSIYLSVYLSRFSSGLQVTFVDDFNAQWLKRRVFATTGAIWGLDNTL